MRKPGHALAEIGTEFPEKFLDQLRRQYSITTVEELLSADRIAGDRLRQSLACDEAAWKTVIGQVREVLPDNEVRRLTTTIPGRPGGAKLTKLSQEQLSRYAGGLSQEQEA